MMFKSAMTVAFICVASVAAIAQTAPAPTASPVAQDAGVSKVRLACAADMQSFCATAEKGKGMIRSCLDSHATELSDACKTARAERAAAKH